MWGKFSEILSCEQSVEAKLFTFCFPIKIPGLIPKKKIVASADLSPGLFSPDDSDTDAAEEPSDESNFSGTPGEDTDMFSTDPDGADAPTTDSDPSQTDFSTPETELATLGADSTTPEGDSSGSETEQSNAGTEELFSAEDLTEPDSSSSSDFSNDFETSEYSDFTPFPEFTTAPETNPSPERELAFAGSESTPESTPPADSPFSGPQSGLELTPSADLFMPDSQPGLDSFLALDPNVPSDQLGLSSEADTSSSGWGSTLLPERNPAPDVDLPTLGEGSTLNEPPISSSSETSAFSDQNTLFFTPEDSSLFQGRSSMPDDYSGYPLFEDGPSSSSSSMELPELGEGLNLVPIELAASADMNLFSNWIGDLTLNFNGNDGDAETWFADDV